MSSIVFVDSEVSEESKKILDLGAIKPDSSQFHSASPPVFSAFVSGVDFICGHNILAHDLKYIGKLLDKQKPPIPIKEHRQRTGVTCNFGRYMDRGQETALFRLCG